VFTDESAWEIGLACGGTIQVWVESLAPEIYATLRQCLETGQLVATGDIIAGPGIETSCSSGRMGDARRTGISRFDRAVVRYAADRLTLTTLDEQLSTLRAAVDVFVEVFPRCPG